MKKKVRCYLLLISSIFVAGCGNQSNTLQINDKVESELVVELDDKLSGEENDCDKLDGYNTGLFEPEIGLYNRSYLVEKNGD